MVTMIVATVVTVIFVVGAMWAGSKFHEADFDIDGGMPWQDDSFD